MGDYFVLIVEDDEAVRELISDLLLDSGYAVRAVSAHTEAIEHVRNPKCRLVVTDLNAPFYTADTRDAVWDQVLAPLRTDRPVPIIVVTGHSAAIGENPAERGVRTILAKPFQLDDLLAEIEAALASSTNDGHQ